MNPIHAPLIPSKARGKVEQVRDLLSVLSGPMPLPVTRVQGATQIPYLKVVEMLRWGIYKELIIKIPREEVNQNYTGDRRKPDALYKLSPKGFEYLDGLQSHLQLIEA